MQRQIAIARVRGTARYASASAGPWAAIAGAFCACALPIGTIAVRFNGSSPINGELLE